MNKTAIRLVAVAAVAGLGIAGCSSKKSSTATTPSSSAPAAATSSAPTAATSSAPAPAASSSAPAAAGGAQVGVILPDTQSSSRWEQQDKPNLTKAFQAAGVKADIQNALGDKAKFVSIGQSMIQEGVKVLIVVDLDSPSGAQVESAAAKAGIKTIDYDRLTLGGGASYYVSFDNVKVGQLQARGLISALKAKGVYGSKPVIAELNGGITDNNGHLFKQGYDSVLNPLYKSGTLKKATAGDQWTDWDPVKGRTIFDQMLARNANHIQGVLAANDGLAGAVIASLQAHGLNPIPLTGQDATPTGVQFILAGWQSGTVYKAIKPEADAAAQVAIDLVKGNTVKTNGKVSGTPSILLKPIWLTKANYTILFRDKFLKKSQVCAGKYAQFCK
jgi:D-xylose transport system substrate-binding protein